MPDWADEVAAKLLEIHAVMRGDKVLALHGTLEPAIAARLRLAKVSGGLDALAEVQQIFGRAS